MNEKSTKVHVRKPASAVPTIYDCSAFWAFIAREKNRANRNGGFFSVVCFNLSDLPQGTRKSADFLRIVAGEMRSVDIIGWLNDDWIGVVLPSTPHKGAEQFAQRIDATDHHKTPPNQIINTYPEHWQLENSERRAAMQAPADSSRKRVGIFLWIVAIIVAGAGFSACGNIAVSQTDSEAGVTVTFGASTYGAPELGFASSDVSISKGQVLNVSTSNPELRDLPNWSWYVNNVRDDTQSSATFSWDTTVCSPGQYIISAAVVYADLRLSGSFRVTVRDIGGV